MLYGGELSSFEVIHKRTGTETNKLCMTVTRAERDDIAWDCNDARAHHQEVYCISTNKE